MYKLKKRKLHRARVSLGCMVLILAVGVVGKPGPRSLFKTVEGTTQPADQTGRSSKPWRRNHVDLLLKISVKKSILHIKLTECPTTGSSNDNQGAHSVHVCHRSAKTDGLVATDVEITGEGTYTVSLDFTGVPGGYANGMAFSALAIGNGELLYPGYTVNITEVLVNGEPYALTAKPYTTSDDARCTRVNLYNEWVTEIPDDARTPDGDTTGISPVVVDNASLAHMETLSITFEYAPGN